MKTAVVTGVSSGLGQAFALALLDNGFKVYGVSRRTPVNELTENSHFTFIKGDLTDAVIIEQIIQTVQEQSIDVLVNNAGIAFRNKTEEWNEEMFLNMFAINYKAPVVLTNALLTKLVNGNGMVITVASDSSHNGWPLFSIYGASKAAIYNHMRTFAAEHPELTTYLIHPDSVITPMTDALDGTPENPKDYMTAQQISTVFIQLVTGMLKLPNGSALFLHNNAQIEDMELLMKNVYLYNTDTEVLTKFENR